MTAPIGLMTLLFAAASRLSPEPPPMAAPADPKPTPGRVESAEVLRGFRAHLNGATDFAPSRVKFVLQNMGDAPPPSNAADSSDPIAGWLAVLSDEFKQGLDAVAAENTDAAVDAFDALSNAGDPYLAVNAALYAAHYMVARERVRDANAMLERVLSRFPDATRYTVRDGELVFLLGYSRFGMIEYDAAADTLSQFLDQYPDAAERFRTNARQIVVELESRRPERLGDVYDLMNFARRELALGVTDEAVEQRQDEAVKLLDKLIAEAEDNEKSGKGAGKGKGGKNSGRDSRKRPQAGSPSAQSTLPQSAADDEARRLQRARLARPGDAWGAMPAKQREEILQSLQKSFPSRYRELVEQYYRELAKESNAP